MPWNPKLAEIFTQGRKASTQRLRRIDLRQRAAVAVGGASSPPIVQAGSKAMGTKQSEKDEKADNWDALVRFDDEIRSYADELKVFGDSWVVELKKAYFALDEDRKYLPNIVKRLIFEAKESIERSRSLDTYFIETLHEKTYDGILCTDKSLKILRGAAANGYTIEVKDGLCTLTGKSGKHFIRSNDDIYRIGEILGILCK